MKTKNKALLLSLCAVLLVAASVFGTLAYLTSEDSVVNTFTIGGITITLDEAKVDNDGKAITGSLAERVKANTYHLLPGHQYDKDPTVHVAANSEDSWIFVKVENGISAYEAATVAGGYTSIAEQITVNGWTALTGVDGVYCKEYTTSATATDLVVFENFKIAENVASWANFNATTTKITVNAYAVQKDGFTTAKAAWDATFGKPVTPAPEVGE